jgi:hypothetical protein
MNSWVNVDFKVSGHDLFVSGETEETHRKLSEELHAHQRFEPHASRKQIQGAATTPNKKMPI